jgi:molecular chaperone IbpA
MRAFDFTPLYRSTIGFDQLLRLADSVGSGDANTGYPPYDIVRTGDNEYRITMAVAGFSQDDLNIEVKETTLKVQAQKTSEETEEGRDYLHRGIAARSFERQFQLADYVEVKGADLKDGLLHIDLVRSVPERLKPRTIAIGSEASTPTRQIEADVSA